MVLSSERLKGEGMKSLIVIFPDQLSLKMSSLKSRTPANADIYMAEWMDLKRGEASSEEIGVYFLMHASFCQ